jgi:hypothetical protein
LTYLAGANYHAGSGDLPLIRDANLAKRFAGCVLLPDTYKKEVRSGSPHAGIPFGIPNKNKKLYFCCKSNRYNRNPDYPGPPNPAKSPR